MLDVVRAADFSQGQVGKKPLALGAAQRKVDVVEHEKRNEMASAGSGPIIYRARSKIIMPNRVTVHEQLATQSP